MADQEDSPLHPNDVAQMILNYPPPWSWESGSIRDANNRVMLHEGADPYLARIVTMAVNYAMQHPVHKHQHAEAMLLSDL